MFYMSRSTEKITLDYRKENPLGKSKFFFDLQKEDVPLLPRGTSRFIRII